MRALRLPIALIAFSLWASAAHADELPVSLQVQLLSKMSTYVSKFAPPGATEVKILVVYPGQGDGPSRGAQALWGALTQAGKLGQYGAVPKLVASSDAKSFETLLAAEKPQVVYLAPELDEKATVAIIEGSSAGKAVTISGVAEHVRLGVVLGFSLVEARPRVLINLKQAQKQNIVFLSGLVKHSLVVDK